MSLLAKGLNFVPTPKKDHPAKTLQDILLFDRKLRLKYHFYQPNSTSDTDTTTDATSNTILKPNFRMGHLPVDRIHSWMPTEVQLSMNS